MASSFAVDGQPDPLPDDNDFHGHRDPDSGKLIGGRMLEQPDCKVHPFFRMGGRHLVFLDGLSHPWSTELIRRDDDQWLLEVRRKILRN